MTKLKEITDKLKRGVAKDVKYRQGEAIYVYPYEAKLLLSTIADAEKMRTALEKIRDCTSNYALPLKASIQIAQQALKEKKEGPDSQPKKSIIVKASRQPEAPYDADPHHKR